MSSERTRRELLLEAYKRPTIRRGLNKKQLTNAMRQAMLLERQLKDETVDRIAELTLSYLEKEEPETELDQWLD